MAEPRVDRGSRSALVTSCARIHVDTGIRDPELSVVTVSAFATSQLSALVRPPVLACADRVEDALQDATGTDPVFMRTPD